MPEQRRRGVWIWVTAGALGCLGVAAGLVWKLGGGDAPKGGPSVAGVLPAELGPDSPLEALAEGLKQGDGMALAVLVQRLTPKEDAPLAPIPEEEAAGWQDVAAGLRHGFPRFSPYGRASAIGALGAVFDRYGLSPAPVGWAMSLEPWHKVMAAGLGDTDARVRIAALKAATGFWAWAPGRDFQETELDAMAEIKEAIHREVVHTLGDPMPQVRAAAVDCLAALPLDDKAAPAVALLNDPIVGVRIRVLQGFADRRLLLDEEAILPLLHDPMPGLSLAAEELLKHRGISDELLDLCKAMVHPEPETRSASIPKILTRTDIDPTVWLIFLSRDGDETVRARAVEALAGRDSAEARARLAEMATSDPSEEIRQAAAKVAPESATTAALPPLPGSPSLNPRAN